MKLKSFMLGLCSIALAFPAFNQDLLITAIFDGTLSGGDPRGVELYVLNDIPDLSLYGIGIANNGGGSDGQEYTFPADAVTAGSYIHLVRDATAFATYFPSETAEYVSGLFTINGDDPIELYFNGIVSDVYGDVAVDGSGLAWDYLDGYSYRLDGTVASTTWNAIDWILPGINTYDGAATNNDATPPMPIGTYSPSGSSIPGCTDDTACNYDMTATVDNGSCAFPGDACDDMDASTVNDVYQGDCSCVGVSNECVKITSVNPVTGEVVIENFGSVDIDVSGYRLCARFQYTANLTSVLTSGDLILSGGESATMTWTLNATSSDLGLYLPTGGFGIAANMLDFTQWGASGIGRESVAVTKGIWTAGDFIDMSTAWNPPYTYTGTFCSETGVNFWTGADCEGTQGGSALEGASCDDGDVMTANDVYLSDCSCAGTPFTLSNDLIITGLYDGPLSGGTPKGVELYVVNDIPDLSDFGIGSANNGEGTDGEEYTFPADAVTAGTFIYVTSGNLTEFTTFFGFDATYDGGNAVAINGDDAVELFEFGLVIDVFGDINVDGSGEAWDHLDGWAYRKCETGPDGDIFDISNWIFSGIDVLDGETDNATALSPVPVGTYMFTCAAGMGCTDPNASNYDPAAVTDDGSCEYLGCTDPLFVEFNPYAMTDDGSCLTSVVEGCVYDSADNYDPLANTDDNSCIFSGTACPGDFTGDGFITVGDLTGFLGVFGSECE